jgi:hypothetical protein
MSTRKWFPGARISHHLFRVDLTVVSHVGENSWVDVSAVCVSTDDQLAFGLSDLDEIGDGLDLQSVSYCANDSVDIRRVALQLPPSGEVALQVLQEKRCERLLDVDSCIGLS